MSLLHSMLHMSQVHSSGYVDLQAGYIGQEAAYIDQEAVYMD